MIPPTVLGLLSRRFWHAALAGPRVPATASTGDTLTFEHTTALLHESKHVFCTRDICVAGVSTQYWNSTVGNCATPPKALASRNLQQGKRHTATAAHESLQRAIVTPLLSIQQHAAATVLQSNKAVASRLTVTSLTRQPGGRADSPG